MVFARMRMGVLREQNVAGTSKLKVWTSASVIIELKENTTLFPLHNEVGVWVFFFFFSYRCTWWLIAGSLLWVQECVCIVDNHIPLGFFEILEGLNKDCCATYTLLLDLAACPSCFRWSDPLIIEVVCRESRWLRAWLFPLFPVLDSAAHLSLSVRINQLNK